MSKRSVLVLSVSKAGEALASFIHPFIHSLMHSGPRLPGEAEPKQAKFEHMLKAGEALAASKGEV